SARPPFTHIRFDMSRSANRLATWTRVRQGRIVSDLVMWCDLTVDWSRCAPVSEPRLRNTGGNNPPRGPNGSDIREFSGSSEPLAEAIPGTLSATAPSRPTADFRVYNLAHP